jgi:hypothetical protein
MLKQQLSFSLLFIHNKKQNDMVKITNYETRKNKENEPFVVLILQGDLVMVQSSDSGRWYATAKQTSITSTFSEEQAKALIGQQIPGSIIKSLCEPYEYTVEETGEVIMLSHRWEFLPENAPTPMRVVVNNMAA